MDVEGLCGNPESASERPPSGAAAVQVAVWFRIGGLLRFLSHAETLRVCQRACARAGVPVKHTMGFNPHPRLSLPLPRSVGVESDDELLVIWLSSEWDGPEDFRTSEERATQIGQALQRELPVGIEVLRVKLAVPGVSFQARSADYLFRYGSDRSADFLDALEGRVRGIMDSTGLTVERKLPGDRRARRIDVRPFIESIQPAGDGLVVRCNVTAAGSIRIGEILQLLELKTEDLAAPVRRTDVKWVAT